MESHREATILQLPNSMMNKKQLSYRLGRRPGQQGPRPLSGDQDKVEKLVTGRNNKQTSRNNDKSTTTPITSIQLRKKFRIGTWNVRSMLQLGKMQILEHEMERLKVDICGLTEVRWEGQGQGHFHTSKGHTVIYSRNEKRGLHGIAIWMHKKIYQAIISCEPVNERMMVVRLNARPKNITMIQAYAPTATAEE